MMRTTLTRTTLTPTRTKTTTTTKTTTVVPVKYLPWQIDIHSGANMLAHPYYGQLPMIRDYPAIALYKVLVCRSTKTPLLVTGFGEGVIDIVDLSHYLGPVGRHDWAKRFPLLHNTLRDLIANFPDALEWSKHYPVDREILVRCVTKANEALRWALNWPGHRDEVLGRLALPDEYPSAAYALQWASTWTEDREKVIRFVTDPMFYVHWAERFPEHKDRMLQMLVDDNGVPERDPEGIFAANWVRVYPDDAPCFQTICYNPMRVNESKLMAQTVVSFLGVVFS